ncbi:MAG: prepilin-type N-terminal cleavage/methylation domain-containing protein [Verrucomicrobiota bacterium]
MFQTSITSVKPRGFTFPELLVTVGIIAVLAGIAIPAYSGITGTAKNVEAEDFAESLNRAVGNFNQANWEIPTAANPDATTDEFLVLRSLQFKNWPAGSFKPGAPYFSAKYNPEASSDSSQHRLRWNGRSFEVLRPGTAGQGFLKTFEGKDYQAADYVFPSGYSPAGSPAGYFPAGV